MSREPNRPTAQPIHLRRYRKRDRNIPRFLFISNSRPCPSKRYIYSPPSIPPLLPAIPNSFRLLRRLSFPFDGSTGMLFKYLWRKERKVTGREASDELGLIRSGSEIGVKSRYKLRSYPFRVKKATRPLLSSRLS